MTRSVRRTLWWPLALVVVFGGCEGTPIEALTSSLYVLTSVDDEPLPASFMTGLERRTYLADSVWIDDDRWRRATWYESALDEQRSEVRIPGQGRVIETDAGLWLAPDCPDDADCLPSTPLTIISPDQVFELVDPLDPMELVFRFENVAN